MCSKDTFKGFWRALSSKISVWHSAFCVLAVKLDILKLVSCGSSDFYPRSKLHLRAPGGPLTADNFSGICHSTFSVMVDILKLVLCGTSDVSPRIDVD